MRIFWFLYYIIKPAELANMIRNKNFARKNKLIFRKSTRPSHRYGAPSSVASSYMPGYSAGISKVVEKYYKNSDSEYISRSQARRYNELKDRNCDGKLLEIISSHQSLYLVFYKFIEKIRMTHTV